MKGVFVPDAVVFGSQPGGGNVADLSDIDLTSAVTDSRLVYACASEHAYFAADGTIQYAAQNVWPLEYRDGVPVGRHEPEPESTNYMNLLHPEQMKQFVASGALTVDAADSMLGLSTVSAHFKTNSDSTAAYAVFGVGSGQQAPHAAGVVSVYISVESPQPFICYTNNVGQIVPTQLTAGLQKFIFRESKAMDYAVMGLRHALADYTALLCGFQFEPGQFVTSPIRAGEQAITRAAATASVKNPGGIATSISVHYSDNTTIDLDFPGDGSEISIPKSVADWGTRYITRIKYFKAI